MSLRTAVRVLLGFGFVFVVAPAVMLWLVVPPESIGARGVLTGVVVEEHGDDFVGGRVERYLTLVTASDRYGLTGEAVKWVKPGQKVRLEAVIRGGQLELTNRAAIRVLAENETPPPAPFGATEIDGESDELVTSAQLESASSSATPAITKRVAVLMVNFVSPTPAPTPTPTPCVDPPTPDPAATPSPDSEPTATPDPTATSTPAPSMCPEPTPEPTPAPTPTPPPQPWTAAEVGGYYFNNTKSVRTFFDEVSNGKMLVTGDVFGWYTLVMNLSTCDYNGIATNARTAATAAGVNLSGYTNISYVFPRVSACGWGGLANVNGPNSWINGKSAMGVYVPAHELGHNFGAHHANALTCTSGGVRVQYSNSCTSAEYADPFDLMGSNASSSGGIRHMHTWHRKQIGLLTTADQQTVTQTGTYTVATAAEAGGVPRILRVAQDSSNSKYYYLEFRQPHGIFDNWTTTSNAVNGVMIRIAPNTSRVQSQLIDTNPATSGFGDAPLSVGKMFVDNVNQRTIITRSISATGATVYIQIGPDVTAPSAPGSLSASLVGPTSVSLAWQAASDEIGVTGYRVTRDGVLLGTVSSLAFTDDNAPQGGTRSYSVAARDAAGNVGPAVSVEMAVPDSLPPSAPGALSVTAGAAGQADLAWQAAVDNVAVAGYRVLRDEVLLATVTDLAYTATGMTSGTTYTFSVVAFDSAGNHGPAASASLLMADITPPSAPGDLSISAATSTTVTLTWTAATDDVGVSGYHVLRDGVVVGTTGLTTFEDAGLSGGVIYGYAVVAFDAAGNVGPPATMDVDPATKLADTLAPVVGLPLTVVAGSGQVVSSKVPLTVSWTADDPSGVSAVQLQQSKNGGAWTTIYLPAGAPPSVTVRRPAGSTYRFRLRATDGMGNTSDWSTGAPFKLVVRQEKNAAIKYAGSWTAVSATSAYGGALRHAKSSTASASLTFSGSSVSWVTSRGPKRGVAEVWVDGVKTATIDLYAATAQPRMVVFSQSWASAGSHTIQVRVKGTGGRPRVDLDAFVFVN